MKSKLFVILMLSLVAVYMCDHLIIGDETGKQKIHHSVENYIAIPFIKREKNVFYNDDYFQRKINAITAYDNLHSKASAIVTAGGIGFTYVNIQMKSERGVGLNYDINIYS